MCKCVRESDGQEALRFHSENVGFIVFSLFFFVIENVFHIMAFWLVYCDVAFIVAD